MGVAIVAQPTFGRESNPKPLDLVHQLNQAFADAAEKVSASVVVISIVQKPAAARPDDEEDNSDGMPPGFWRRFHEQLKRPGQEQTLGQGSGVIIRKDGYILTNNHVVEDAESIQVRLQDGRTFQAVLHGIDPQSDLAVLKIDADQLPVAAFADSTRTRVGEFAIAVGTPYSLDYSVTFGHVSAKGRSNVLEGYELPMMDQDFIQTDALINPGNSGGPLVNIDGEVIGINTLIQGFHTGIGFAIPSNLAKEVADELVSQRKFTRGWLGIAIDTLASEHPSLSQGVAEGILVKRIVPEGPAAKSDLKAGDVITAIDGQRINTPQQLRTEVRNRIGRMAVLNVARGADHLQVKVTPREWVQPTAVVTKITKEPSPESPAPAFGVTVQNVTAELAKKIGVPAEEGVLVTSVETNSPAAGKGLKVGDIITSVNDQPVNTPKEFNSALKQVDSKKGLMLNFFSSSAPGFEAIRSKP